MHSVTCLLQGRRGRRWSQSPSTTCCSSRRRWIRPQRRSSHEVLVLEGQGLLSQRRERACDQVTRPSRLYLGTAHVAICQSVPHPLFICPLHKPPSILSSIHILSLPPSLHPSLPPSIVLPPLPSIFTHYPLVLSVADPKPRVPCSIGSPVRAGGYAPRLWEIQHLGGSHGRWVTWQVQPHVLTQFLHVPRGQLTYKAPLGLMLCGGLRI